MTPTDLLTAIGRALFGDRWKADMTRTLRLRRAESVDDWSDGRGAPPPPGVWRDLVTEIEQRERELGALKVEAMKLAGPRKGG